MKRSIKSLLAALVVFLSLAAPVLAGPYEDGLAAYERGDYATALRLWLPLAERGRPEMQTFVGSIYAVGKGVPQDLAEAAKWFRKAAGQGLAEAQYNLGILYEAGQGVPQDIAAAAKWYRKAAEQGDANAQNNLGFMYATGEGVPKDYVEAHRWFNLAATRGHKDATRNIDAAAKLMTPAQIAEAQRLAREWKPKK